MSGTHSLEDRFETLCHIAADISAAPIIPRLGKSGKMCYARNYDIVLLVGLTELKVEIRWIDSTTVRVHAGKTTGSDFVIATVGDRGKVSAPRASAMLYLRLTWGHSSDAVIIYNDGSENTCTGSRVVPPPD